ncbi:MAG: hypothetical protein QM778_07070 [Myxococcales bacterium]
MPTEPRLCIPRPRARGLLGLARRLWTAPTSVLGYLLASLLGCGRGERVGGEAVCAWLYRLPEGRMRGLGAIAIGHVIIVEPRFLAGREAWVLAHELSHARQHDWLGPTYLLVHLVLQLVSALASLGRRRSGFPPQHAYNPLERGFLCVPFDVLTLPQAPVGVQASQVLRAFGLAGPA